MFNRIDDLLADIELLGSVKTLSPDEFSELKERLRTPDAEKYVDIILAGGKPETALSEYVFRPLLEGKEYLSLNLSPQIKAGKGWVDYLIQHYTGNPVAVELKPLHVTRAGKIVLSQLEAEFLRLLQDDKNQVKQYLRDYDYVLFTNLKEVYYFNREAIFEFKPFLKEPFVNLVKDLTKNPDLWDVVRRKEDITPKHDLDQRFFADLKKWYAEMEEVEFTSSKEEQIVRILSKFIFVKTLEDYGLIPFNFLKDTFADKEKKWKAKGYAKVLSEFLQEVDKWCYEYYDTELFREDTFRYLVQTEKNLARFRAAIERVLGLSEWSATFGIGLLYYNYRSIDEDIFGKAYETFLAEQKKQQGIYYTPADVTEHMSRMIVAELFVPIKNDLLNALEAKDYEQAKNLALRLSKIRIIDPACGSGSFLIKVLRHIWNVYQEINQKTLWAVDYTTSQTIFEPDHIRLPREKTIEVREILGLGKESHDGRRLIALLILRHLHGIDLDGKALDVAKVNIWKEALKLAPEHFRYSALPRNVSHVLPDLESNFINADTLIDLPTEKCYELLAKYRDSIRKMQELRNSYLSNPWNPSIIEQYKKIKNTLLAELSAAFRTEYGQAPSIPLFAPLNFHYCYFNDAADPEEDPGFDGIIGNPPYDVFEESPFHKLSDAAGTRNLFAHFIVKGIQLNKKRGALSFIVPLSFSCGSTFEKVRRAIYQNYGNLKAAHYSIRPSKIFPEAEQRTTIFFARNKGEGPCVVESSRLYRFNHCDREKVIFTPVMGCAGVLSEGFIPRVADDTGASVYKKFNAITKTVADYLTEDNKGYPVFYHSVGRYWLKAYDFIPYFTRNGIPGISTNLRQLVATSPKAAKAIVAVLNSNLFYFWWIIQSDEFHVLNNEVLSMPLPESVLSDEQLIKATEELMKEYQRSALRKKLQVKGVTIEMDEIHPRKSLPFILRIDAFLAPHYGLSEAELNFLQNYDMEFRQNEEDPEDREPA
ncbi:Eco57I restriction-modification methylase [Thermanaeromonas toyohensis ToBE]|uniref:site-specific DNA-methyltransferase (adenine-specific) n=1 Tax=Thermanaeromonas toyohensis ToBE TaxID=698762 RepID=A0A1W1VUZ9_9FIRM|nr:N-6 DNA methylase [Thermanaeromonas toyohensis]SMB96704.1 Eco57I restriction-modification methylase [Thermanaeromonas toyohensis ToBE]